MNYKLFFKKVINRLKAEFWGRFHRLSFFLSKMVPDRIYLEHRYKRLMGKKLNLNPPITFNEKLNWMKLYDRNPLYTQLADKYAVKEYVKEKIGEEYLVPLLGVWDDANDIDFDKLPEKFVLKCTHDSGSCIICRNKDVFDRKSAIKRLNKALKINYYYYSREWVYKNIPRRIIAEQFIEDMDDKETRDYKIFTFDGEPRFLYIATDRGIGATKFDYFDLDFNHIDVRQHYPNSDKVLHKPKNYELMLDLSRKLSSGLRHARIDFYEVNGKIYFGEYTFYNNGGVTAYDPESWDYKFGEWLNI